MQPANCLLGGLGCGHPGPLPFEPLGTTESVTPSASNGSGDLNPDTYVHSLRARRSKAERDLRIRLLARTTLSASLTQLVMSIGCKEVCHRRDGPVMNCACRAACRLPSDVALNASEM